MTFTDLLGFTVIAYLRWDYHDGYTRYTTTLPAIT